MSEAPERVVVIHKIKTVNLLKFLKRVTNSG